MYYAGRQTGYRGLASYKDPETGKQRRKSVTRKTRSETEKALKILIGQLPRGGGQQARTAMPASVPPAWHPDTLHTLLGRWLEYKRRDVCPTTHRDYVHALRFVLPVLGERRPSSLTVLDVEHLVQTLHHTHGPKTAGRVLGRLRMALRQAVVWQLLAVNQSSSRSLRSSSNRSAAWALQALKLCRSVVSGAARRAAAANHTPIRRSGSKSEFVSCQCPSLRHVFQYSPCTLIPPG
ncbi:hypothetical protein [Deinococcus radiopugnans]|uniref:hypothetical protein n=1 Tax=Deinococcus radiopugnans TaxID=57497 RepID=UPI0012E06352|nr:hypothetical protein [Deinococcus radiopugnans]